MDFVFQGFQSGIPVWLAILLLVLSAAAAWWSYSSVPALSPTLRYGLTGLRTLVFFILLSLLLNPLFRSETTRHVRPSIQLMFDNSASTSIEKGDYNGIESYRNTIQALNLSDSSNISFKSFLFDDNVAPAAPESLTFEGGQTSLNDAVQHIKDRENELKGAVLLSDGIFTRGRNPSFLAGELQVPVIAIALGDTSRMQDLIVRNVVTDNQGYVNTTHVIETSILSNGFEGRTFDVELRSGTEVVQTQTVTPDEYSQVHNLDFELALEEEGLHQFEIHIPELEEEWTADNNTHSFSIDVSDARLKVLHLAFEVHPDVKAIRSVIESDRNMRVYPRTWLGNNRFIEGGLAVDSDTLDLVVLHGYPPGGVSDAVEASVDSLLNENGSLLISTPRQFISAASSLDPNRLITSDATTPGGREATLQPAMESADHPVMELPEIAYNRIPPLVTPDGELSLAGDTQTLFTSRFRGEETGSPLIAVREIADRRSTQIEGFGWYRLVQSDNDEIRNFTETLLYRLLTWTAEQPDDRRLVVEPDRQMFSGGETVSFTAFLNNESGDREPDAEIQLTVSGEDMDSRIYSMDPRENGRYELDIGTLPEGAYRFEAVAEKEGREIDRREGDFSVGGTSEEYVNTVRDDGLLRNIAENSGGAFFTFEEAGQVREAMEEMGWTEPEEETTTRLFYPYRHAFWFILVILLLGMEWGLRKYASLP